MRKPFVILTRDKETENIAFATPKDFHKVPEAEAYAEKHLKDLDWLVVHSAFAKDIIELKMWKNTDEGDV